MAAAGPGVPCVTTLPGLSAAVQGIEALRGAVPGRRVAAGVPCRGRRGRPSSCRPERPRSRRASAAPGEPADAGEAGGDPGDAARSCPPRKAGLFHSLTLVAPDIADRARPGQFVEIAMPAGPDVSCARPFSIHQASRRGGWAGTLEFVVRRRSGPGPTGSPRSEPHQLLDVIGPLGRPFELPRKPVTCLLVGGGYGAAPLYFLAEELRARDTASTWSSAARDHDRVFKPIEGKRLATAIVGHHRGRLAGGARARSPTSFRP